MSPITDGRMRLAEHARQAHVVSAPAGTPLQSILAPDFWLHVAYRLHPFDRIEVHTEDGAWYADLLVTGLTRKNGDAPQQVDVRLLYAVDLTEARVGLRQNGAGQIAESVEPMDESLPTGIAVEWGGPVHKWRVLRVSDRSILRHGLTKHDAFEWARANLRDAA